MVHDNRFANYVSVRKATPKEIEEEFAYKDATVTTIAVGLKGLKATLDSQFPGEDFHETNCDAIVDSEYEQLLNGYVAYSTKISYVERINERGQTYCAVEEYGGMHRYI